MGDVCGVLIQISIMVQSLHHKWTKLYYIIE